MQSGSECRPAGAAGQSALHTLHVRTCTSSSHQIYNTCYGRKRKKNQSAFTAQPRGNVVKFDLHFIPTVRRSYSRPPPSPATTSRAVPWKHVLPRRDGWPGPPIDRSELARSVITRHSIVFVKALHTPPAACPSRRRRNQPERERDRERTKLNIPCQYACHACRGCM